MTFQILDFNPVFLIPSTLNDSVVNSQSYKDDRRKALEKCLSEDKWYLNLPFPPGVEIPSGIAEEHFLDRYFAGWDDGFLLAYKRKNSVRENYNERDNCTNNNFHRNQAEDLGKFAVEYGKMLEEKSGIALSFEDVLSLLLRKYSEGLGAGYKAGYCGFVCPENRGCYQGKVHDVSDMF